MDINLMTVLITGAASGIGHALSLGFLDDGAKVVAVDINPEGLKPLAEKGAVTRTVDVTDPAQVDGMVQTAVDETGRLDVLFNNAGLGLSKKLCEHEPNQFEKLISVNLIGPYYGMRAAIPVMREQGFGRIISLLSRGAEAGAPGMGAYGASKAGLFALTRTVARETADADILVNGLIPGISKTGMMPFGQDPSLAYSTAHMLATLPTGGPTGKVFWDEKEYFLFDESNETFQR